MVSPEKRFALDFFDGGVPAPVMFEMSLNNIGRALQLSIDHNFRRLTEISYISLISYFEAFYKDHAGSLVNIAPTLLIKFRDAGISIQIEAHRAIELDDLFKTKVGFLVMENVDFENAKKINSVFNALLKLTPFPNKEANRYEEILRDRNLLVHHGSIYTAKYLEQARPHHR